jgi:phosphatidylserine decarboxylase
MITKYGLNVVVNAILLAVVIIVGSVVFFRSDTIKYGVVGLVGLLVVVVVFFFRDPDRVPPGGNHIVVSPADGRVVAIKELYEAEYLKQNAVQLSIFMSPLDVHVNRFPISGRVGYFKNIKGKYLIAFNEKSSEKNEQTHVGIEQNGYRLLCKQIAGAVARRIITDVEIGRDAVVGERFGMVRFGSRVDVIMPAGTVVKVALRDRVFAGETILAVYA